MSSSHRSRAGITSFLKARAAANRAAIDYQTPGGAQKPLKALTTGSAPLI